MVLMKEQAVVVALLTFLATVGVSGVGGTTAGTGMGAHTVSFGLLALGATARPSSYSGETGRLVLAAAGAVGIAAVTVLSDAPTVVAVVAISVVAAGEGTATLIDDEAAGALAFAVVGGAVGAAAGVFGTEAGLAMVSGTVAFAVFAAATARSTGASLWLTVVSAAAGGWAVTLVDPSVSAGFLATGAFAVVGFAAGANLADAMTVSGASAGALLSYVVLVAGGVGWLVVLGAFVVTGSVATEYGRDEKREMGLAEHTEGRGFRNVAANGAVAFVAAFAYAVAPTEAVAQAAAFGFVGCMATATADTASSEIGSVMGEPRLITTLERVPPGTDGGVSWQGEVIALVSSVCVGVVAYLLGVVPAAGAAVGAFGGLVGVHADSVLGATVEGSYLENEGVNCSACAVGAVAAAGIGYSVYFL